MSKRGFLFHDADNAAGERLLEMSAGMGVRVTSAKIADACDWIVLVASADALADDAIWETAKAAHEAKRLAVLHWRAVDMTACWGLRRHGDGYEKPTPLPFAPAERWILAGTNDLETAIKDLGRQIGRAHR